jgi:hypothetical protein
LEIVLLLLIQALLKRRSVSYTPAQLEAIKQAKAAERARFGLPPLVEKPKSPHRWWRYSGVR